jgi:non-homologous end joining protein Ku
MEELQMEWGDPKKFKDNISEAELERIRKKISSRKTKPY